MKLKKKLSIFFTLALATSMIGCGGQKADTTAKPATTNEAKAETAQPASDEKVKLRLMSLSTDENQIKILENYIKKNLAAELPNVEIEFEPGGGGEDFANKLKTYNASGDLPDVWYSAADYATAVISAGNQLDFTQHITDDGFIGKFAIPEALKFSDGKIYALSAGADTYFTPRIFYHKDIFEQNNIAIPKTFDEFMTACKALKEKGIVPMSIMGKGGWGPQLYMVQTMIQSEDPQVALDLLQNKTDFTNPAVVNAVKKIETMVKEGVFPEGVANLDYGPSLELFTAKKTAMFGGFTWETANLGADPNIGMFMWPTSNDQYPTGDVTQFWGSPLNGYGVNAKSENLEMAVKLAEYCVSQEALFYAEQGSKLNLQTDVAPAEQSELMKENIKLYENTKLKIPTIFLNAMDAKTGTEFGTLGGSLLTGAYTAEQYVEDFNTIWQENTWFKK
jgi:raffinose/stachyose/melibiose transport system substrate-binding protein